MNFGTTKILKRLGSVLSLVVLVVQSQVLRVYCEPYTWTTIAGSAAVGGDVDGIGSVARFEYPSGIAQDRAGNLYVADSWNGAVRKLTQIGTNWLVSTIATNFSFPKGIALDQAGNIYVADYNANAIHRLRPDGTNWLVDTIVGPEWGVNASWITVDTNGNLFVTDSQGSYVEKISPSGTNWVGTLIAGTPGEFGSVDGTNMDARFGDPEGIAVDNSGNLYIAEWWSFTVRKVAPSGTNWIVTTIAGTTRLFGFIDGTNNDALFTAPMGITVDSWGNLFVTDQGMRAVRKMTPIGTDWVVSTVAGPENGDFNWPSGVTVSPQGTVLVVDNEDFTIRSGVPFIPTLQYTNLDNKILLSWPLISTGFVLEATASLNPVPIWTQVADQPVISGASFVVTSTPPTEKVFYRLHK